MNRFSYWFSIVFFGLSELLFAPRQLKGDELAKPIAQGEIANLRWQLRLTLPECKHDGHVANAWCRSEDHSRALKKSGIQGQLLQWIENPKIRSIYIASFSFTNKTIARALCQAANSRKLRVKIYIARQLRFANNIKMLRRCSPNIKVIPRGSKDFDIDGYIQHAKVFLASELPNALPLAVLKQRLSATNYQKARSSLTHFTSTSANLSNYGVGLHFENWLFFSGPSAQYTTQENICFFYALDRMRARDIDEERRDFSRRFAACRHQIDTQPIAGLNFFAVPHGGENPEAFKELRAMILAAKESIKIAIHRLTTRSLWGLLVRKHQEGVKIILIMDDDTLRSGKCRGGSSLLVNANSVHAFREMLKQNLTIRMVPTNGNLPHLFHHKFIIVDDKKLFQGAGNFTSKSLNTWDLGNFEQFYIIDNPEIVAAFGRGWDYFYNLSLPAQDHEVFNHRDKELVPDPEIPGLLSFNEDSCRD